jgi:serine/threonine-protein phosphatase 6 regulatory subunit 3
MFWRFGLNSSAVDNLLDKEDLTLEELLDEEELLQECKAHNNKLIELYVLRAISFILHHGSFLNKFL